MKKTLLLLAFASISGMVSAQAVFATKESLEAAGLSSDKTNFPAGTVIAEDAAIGSMELAYDDSWGTTTTYKNYQNVKVGEFEVTLGSGAVGNSNPTFVSYEEGVMSGGAVFLIKANQDGYITVFTKINPNKQYLVFEGKTGCLSYSLGVAGSDYQIYYTTPTYTEGPDEGYIDFTAPDASKYFIPATRQMTNEAGVKLWERSDTHEVVAADTKPTVPEGESYKWNAKNEEIEGQNKPQFPWLIANNLGATFEKAPGESTGFMTFNVLAENEYYISALGSKAAMGGFVFTAERPDVVFQATDELPEVTFKASGEVVSGVESVAVAENADAPVYNLMGVRVNSDAKGLLIQNGKKFIRK